MKVAVVTAYKSEETSVRRLARVFGLSGATVGRWVCRSPAGSNQQARPRPVTGDPTIVALVRELCDEPRHLTFGHRRIRAMLRRRYGLIVSRKSVLRIMRDQGLSRPKIWHRTWRPKRVNKMVPVEPNRAWQIDMTSFQLSDLRPLFLVVVIDCFTRQITGWGLSHRCRASEWVSTIRTALESKGLTSKELCRSLTLRSDNGAQPCSKKFVEYLGSVGVHGQYTGYNAPDDNAFVERIMRTLKEEEIWPNLYDTITEAREAVGDYIRYYNSERIHSALNYRTPDEAAAAHVTLAAA
jgi:putative transposase